MNFELFNQTGPGRYYNANGLSGDELKQKKIKAGSLAEEVLTFFEYRPIKAYTAWQVFNHIGKHRPITSVRRAISDLVKSGLLEYTGELIVDGPYSEPCRKARSNSNHPSNRQ